MPDIENEYTPSNNASPLIQDDGEASMARADLYKLHQYSRKLFKIIETGDELEGWVQAKITKAADYIASVYHFMEYQKKFSEYGEKLNDSDIYTESVKQQYVSKLIEARTKLDKLKTKNIKDLEEESDDLLSGKKTEEVNKSSIPAFKRKAKGGDWKVNIADLEKEAGKSPTSKAGLDAKKKSLGMKEEVNKSSIPAFKRKAKGGDWKVNIADLEKEAGKSPTSKAGLDAKKKSLGISKKKSS